MPNIRQYSSLLNDKQHEPEFEFSFYGTISLNAHVRLKANIPSKTVSIYGVGLVLATSKLMHHPHSFSQESISQRVVFLA